MGYNDNTIDILKINRNIINWDYVVFHFVVEDSDSHRRRKRKNKKNNGAAVLQTDNSTPPSPLPNDSVLMVEVENVNNKSYESTEEIKVNHLQSSLIFKYYQNNKHFNVSILGTFYTHNLKMDNVFMVCQCNSTIYIILLNVRQFVEVQIF